jgi:hypothetical protein
MTLNFWTNFKCNRNVTALFQGKFQKRTHLPGKDNHSSLTVMARLCRARCPAAAGPAWSLTHQPACRKTRDPLQCDGTYGWHWVRRCGTGIEGIHMKAATAGPPEPRRLRRPARHWLASVNHQAKLNRRGIRAGWAFNPVPKFNHGPFKLLVDSESRNHGPKFGLLI